MAHPTEATIAEPGSAKTVDELLAQARGILPHRPSPHEALHAQASGALLSTSAVTTSGATA